MPKERISILSSYVFSEVETTANCEDRLAALKKRFDAQAHHMHQMWSSVVSKDTIDIFDTFYAGLRCKLLWGMSHKCGF